MARASATTSPADYGWFYLSHSTLIHDNDAVEIHREKVVRSRPFFSSVDPRPTSFVLQLRTETLSSTITDVPPEHSDEEGGDPEHSDADGGDSVHSDAGCGHMRLQLRPETLSSTITDLRACVVPISGPAEVRSLRATVLEVTGEGTEDVVGARYDEGASETLARDVPGRDCSLGMLELVRRPPGHLLKLLFSFQYRSRTRPIPLSKFSVLSSDMMSLLGDDTFADVTFVVGREDEDGKERFRAHKNVLATRCPYFRGLFSSGMRESEAEEIALPESPDTFRKVLEFIYSDKPPTAILENPVDLIFVADKYGLVDLFELCVPALEANVCRDNVIEMLLTANTLRIHDLIRFCQPVFLSHFLSLKDSIGWNRLKECPELLLDVMEYC